MNRDDIQKLLGGYATGTLTAEEQQALFEAALDDQELFDALAREQALADLLRDPASKAELLAALDRRPPRWYERVLPSWRPLAAAAAMAGVSALAVMVWQGAKAPKPVLMARATFPPPAAPAIPEPTPADADKSPAPPAASARPVAGTREFRAAAPKEGETTSTADETTHEKDQSAKAKPDAVVQMRPAESPAALKKEEPVLPRQGVIAGFRDGAPAGMAGGPVGGVLGGTVGGTPANAPGAPPPPPAPVRQEVGNSQAAAETKQAPGGPAQQQSPQLAQAGAPQSEQARVPVQNAKASLDAVAMPDARTLFYGGNPQAAGGGGGSGGMAGRKKAVDPNVRAQGVANSVAVSSGAVQSMLGTNLGVRYALLRKNASGVFETVTADSLKTADVVELQVIPNMTGFLVVQARTGSGPWREVTSHSVTAMQTYITKALKPGEDQVQIRLTPSPMAFAASALRDDRLAGNPTRQSYPEPATYVVAPAGSRQLQFTVTLNYR